MSSALGSIQVPPPAPETEPAICPECGVIADIPIGVKVLCTLDAHHEEETQMLTTRLLFQILQAGFGRKQIPEIAAIWGHYLQRMRELQEHIIPKDQVATAGPPEH